MSVSDRQRRKSARDRDAGAGARYGIRMWGSKLPAVDVEKRDPAHAVT